MIVVQPVGYLNFEFPLADTIIKHDDYSVVLDSFVMNLAVFQDNLPDTLIDLCLLFRLQQVEVQVRRKAR